MTETNMPVSPKKILIVEDEEYLRDLYVQILQDEGYSVDIARDGQEGYEKMRANGFDLVLLDVMLPKIDGLTILERLHNEHKQTNKKVILMTNLGQDSIIARALALGVQGYLVKSDYTPDQLLQEITSNLASLQQ